MRCCWPCQESSELRPCLSTLPPAHIEMLQSCSAGLAVLAAGSAPLMACCCYDGAGLQAGGTRNAAQQAASRKHRQMLHIAPYNVSHCTKESSHCTRKGFVSPQVSRPPPTPCSLPSTFLFYTAIAQHEGSEARVGLCSQVCYAGGRISSRPSIAEELKPWTDGEILERYISVGRHWEPMRSTGS